MKHCHLLTTWNHTQQCLSRPGCRSKLGRLVHRKIRYKCRYRLRRIVTGEGEALREYVLTYVLRILSNLYDGKMQLVHDRLGQNSAPRLGSGPNEDVDAERTVKSSIGVPS